MKLKYKYKSITLILLLSFILTPSVAQDRQSSDSLKILLMNAKTDSVKISCLAKLAVLYDEYCPDSTENFYNQALNIALAGSDNGLKIKSYFNLGLFYSNTGNYKKALEIFQLAMKLSVEEKDLKNIASCYNYMGEIYLYQCDYTKALDLLLKSAKYLEELDKTKSDNTIKDALVACYNDLGAVHAENGNYKQSVEYFKKALAIVEKTGDKLVIAGCNNNIGNVYYMQNDYPVAVEYYKKALLIAEEMNDRSSMSERYNNLGVVYTEMKKYNEAIDYYEKSLKIDKELGDQKGMSLVLGNIALLNIGLKKYDEAILSAQQSLIIAQNIGSLDEEKCAYEYLSVAYDSLKDYRSAYKYLKLFKLINDSIFSIESSRQVKEMEAMYQTEKNQKEIELLNKDKELQKIEISRQETQKYAFIAGFALMLILSFVVFWSYTQKRKANKLLTKQKALIEEKNEELNQQNEEITSQRDEIETQRNLVFSQKEHIEVIHRKVTDSINYAKKIQEAVLPNSEATGKILGEHFILYKPKDIVSGDFYWATRVNNWLVVTVADCTGHGVPGGFMSMLGISFLNEIVRKKEVTQANHVLNYLRREIIGALNQKGTEGEQKDGMDISLCAINTETKEMHWAGANNPLYIVSGSGFRIPGEVDPKQETRNPELREIKGDSMPISIHRNMADFKNHVISYSKGDIIYLCTDGFCDQFGGPNNRKFLSKNLRKMLKEICEYPMEHQKILLNTAIESWMNYNGNKQEQTDDITIVGIKL